MGKRRKRPSTAYTSAVAHVGTEAVAELIRARSIHEPMNSAHEAYAVLLEESDELWAEIKNRDPGIDAIRKEAIQVAAMALALVVEVCDGVEP